MIWLSSSASAYIRANGITPSASSSNPGFSYFCGVVASWCSRDLNLSEAWSVGGTAAGRAEYAGSPSSGLASGCEDDDAAASAGAGVDGNGGRDDLYFDDNVEKCEDDFRSREEEYGFRSREEEDGFTSQEEEALEGEGDLSERFRVRAVRASSRLLWITPLYLSVRSLAQVSTSGERSGPDIGKVGSNGASFSNNGDAES